MLGFFYAGNVSGETILIDAQSIKDLGKDLGIELRITHARPFSDEAEKIKEQVREGLFLNTRYWQDDDIVKFCDVRSVLPSAKSIISACLGYLTPLEPNPSQPGNPYGIVAPYTRANYYQELKKRLQKIGRFLKRKFNAKTISYSCAWIAEKPIARRSGIGYYGKHSIIINTTYGSWVVLGEIITDLEIDQDEPLRIDCGRCQRCIDTCPTKAIIRPYVIDRRKCIQALTNWPGIIPDDIAAVWEDRLYGCATCQEVCPKNEKIKPENPKTDIGVVGAYLPLMEILKMDEPAYRKRYAKNQITSQWINFEAIKRNALLALGNIRDKLTYPTIKKWTKESNPIIAQAAQWAVKNF